MLRCKCEKEGSFFRLIIFELFMIFFIWRGGDKKAELKLQIILAGRGNDYCN
jgi:hypothetical protein